MRDVFALERYILYIGRDALPRERDLHFPAARERDRRVWTGRVLFGHVFHETTGLTRIRPKTAGRVPRNARVYLDSGISFNTFLEEFGGERTWLLQQRVAG